MRRLISVLIVMTALAAGAEPALDEAGSPGLTVSTEHLDAGHVLAGASVEGVFRFENSSDRPIRILRAKPS